MWNLSIKYLQWFLRKEKAYNVELVIRTDGITMHKRDKEKEKEEKKRKKIKKILNLITVNSYVPKFKNPSNKK